MNFKFSNITFYKRHNSELERYLEHRTSLHIINIKSKDKITEKATKNLYIDSEKENYEEAQRYFLMSYNIYRKENNIKLSYAVLLDLSHVNYKLGNISRLKMIVKKR